MNSYLNTKNINVKFYINVNIENSDYLNHTYHTVSQNSSSGSMWTQPNLESEI